MQAFESLVGEGVDCWLTVVGETGKIRRPDQADRGFRIQREDYAGQSLRFGWRGRALVCGRRCGRAALSPVIGERASAPDDGRRPSSSCDG